MAEINIILFVGDFFLVTVILFSKNHCSAEQFNIMHSSWFKTLQLAEQWLGSQWKSKSWKSQPPNFSEISTFRQLLKSTNLRQALCLLPFQQGLPQHKCLHHCHGLQAEDDSFGFALLLGACCGWSGQSIPFLIPWALFAIDIWISWEVSKQLAVWLIPQEFKIKPRAEQQPCPSHN